MQARARASAYRGRTHNILRGPIAVGIQRTRGVQMKAQTITSLKVELGLPSVLCQPVAHAKHQCLLSVKCTWSILCWHRRITYSCIMLLLGDRLDSCSCEGHPCGGTSCGRRGRKSLQGRTARVCGIRRCGRSVPRWERQARRVYQCCVHPNMRHSVHQVIRNGSFGIAGAAIPVSAMPTSDNRWTAIALWGGHKHCSDGTHACCSDTPAHVYTCHIWHAHQCRNSQARSTIRLSTALYRH